MARTDGGDKPGRGGRQPSLTEDLALRIAAIVEEGNFHVVAASLCGVKKKTMEKWVTKGNQRPDSIYGEFVGLLKEAAAKSQANAVSTLRRHAAVDPASNRFYLERRHHEFWGKYVPELIDLRRQVKELREQLDRVAPKPPEPPAGDEA